jgi:hypothetical protein
MNANKQIFESSKQNVTTTTTATSGFFRKTTFSSSSSSVGEAGGGECELKKALTSLNHIKKSDKCSVPVISVDNKLILGEHASTRTFEALKSFNKKIGADLTKSTTLTKPSLLAASSSSGLASSTTTTTTKNKSNLLKPMLNEPIKGSKSDSKLNCLLSKPSASEMLVCHKEHQTAPTSPNKSPKLYRFKINMNKTTVKNLNDRVGYV